MVPDDFSQFTDPRVREVEVKHCKSGHVLNETNIYLRRVPGTNNRFWKSCKTCIARRAARHETKKKLNRVPEAPNVWIKRIRTDDVVRFLEKRAIGPGCWEWLGNKNPQGYGHFTIKRRPFGAHRVAWVLAHDKCPGAGIVVRHKCDNPGCVRPGHLELGTQADNLNDMKVRGRARAPSGERHRSARLTWGNVDTIRLDKRLHAIIAEEYGVSPRTITSVKAGDTWRRRDGFG